MAQLKSRSSARVQNAAVRLPPAGPDDRQCIVPARTWMCPVGSEPRAPPSRWTSASRDWVAEAFGQGWLFRQVPSVSRAAMPPTRTRGPSAHHMGPSPSQTATGVQVKGWPVGTIAAARIASTITHQPCHLRPGPVQRDNQDHRALEDGPWTSTANIPPDLI